MAASAPGIMAPYSCPKFPRIPQPMDSAIAAAAKNLSEKRDIPENYKSLLEGAS
jgi:hypothetical protein